VPEIAETFAALMADVLGYRRFGAQGGDGGSFVSARLAAEHPDRLIGIHLNFMPLRRDIPRDAGARSPEEAAYLTEEWLREETVPVDPGDAAPDARLRSHRLAGRARERDRREAPALDGLRR
jgi:pimeloyl-ACP methyl ester carboxylesterase